MWNIPSVKNAQKALSLFTQLQVVFGEVEANGIKIDVPYLAVCIEDTKQRIEDLKQSFYRTKIWKIWQMQYGKAASLTARQQLGTVLFDNIKNRRGDNMGYTCTCFTKSGLAEVSERTLNKLSGVEDFCENYILYMSLQKLLETNLYGIQSVLDPQGFIHPSFSLFSVVSYRTSCLAKGTLIMVNRGYDRSSVGIPIEEIKEGDFVYCFDDNLQPCLRKVLWAGKTGHKKVIRVHFMRHGGKKSHIDMTPEHKLRMADGTYVEAKDVMSYRNRHFHDKSVLNHSVLSIYRESHRIVGVEEIDIETDVYDIEVDEFHNFIANEVCVHNCSSPNFQNIPVRDAVLRNIVRKCFIPREPDNQLIEVDYSGAEVRITAHLTQDPTLLASIREGRDFHKEAAATVYKLPIEDVTKTLRQSIKGNLTFAAFYGSYWKQMAPALWEGIGQEKLCTKDGIPLFDHLKSQGIYELGNPDNPCVGSFYKHIKDVEGWFWGELFPVFRQWKEDTYKRYLNTGYLDLVSGFRCYGNFAKNAVLNLPTQGFAAHCLLRSLANIHKRLKVGRFKTKIVGQIHDSIILDVYPNEKDDVITIVKEEMEINTPKYYNLTVPMEVDVAECPVGQSWADKQ